MAAYDAGVPLYAGSDGGGVSRHGNLAGRGGRDGRARHARRSTRSGAASWRAREWLGWNPTLDEGAPADLVVYDRDPRDDLTVLHTPARVVLAVSSLPDGRGVAVTSRAAVIVRGS